MTIKIAYLETMTAMRKATISTTPLLILLICGACVSNLPPAGLGFDTYYQRGKELLAKKKYVEASFFLQAASKLKPESVETLMLLVESYSSAKQHKKALEIADQAMPLIKDNAQLASLYTKIGKSRIALGDHAGAVTVRSRAVDLKPTDAELYLDLGESLINNLKFADSANVYLQAYSLDRQAPAAYKAFEGLIRSRALYQMSRQKVTEREQRWRDILIRSVVTLLVQKSDGASICHGFFIEQHRLVSALHCFEGAEFAIAKLHDGTNHELQTVLSYDVSKDLITFQIPPTVTSYQHVKVGETPAKVGDEILVVIANHYFDNPSLRDIRLSKGRVALRMDKWVAAHAPAMQGMSGSIVIDRRGYVIGVLSSVFLDNLFSIERAIETTFADIRSLKKVGMTTRPMLLSALGKQKNFSIHGRVNKIRRLGFQGKCDEAFSYANKNFDDEMRSLEFVQDALARLYFRCKKYKEAKAMQEALLKSKPDSHSVHEDLAEASLKLGQIEEASKHIERAMILDPSNSSNYSLKASILKEAGKPETVVGLLEKSVSLEPKNYWSWYGLCAAYYNSRRPQLAISACLQATKIVPTFLEAYDLLAFIYSKTNDQDKFTETISKVERYNPKRAATIKKKHLEKQKPKEDGADESGAEKI